MSADRPDSEHETRNLFFQMMTSVDGRIAGPEGELDWHVVDQDFSDYVDRTLRSIDAILLGRVTYEGFAHYWPTSDLPEAPLMNGLEKVVFSTTLDEPTWQNSRIVAGDVGAEVARLKEQPGNDLAVFGSATLASALVRLGLIDEYRILVCPVILGEGRPMFPGLARRARLVLRETETFGSGTTCLYYEPAARD